MKKDYIEEDKLKMETNFYIKLPLKKVLKTLIDLLMQDIKDYITAKLPMISLKEKGLDIEKKF